MDPFDLTDWEGYNGPSAVIDAVAIHTEQVTATRCLFVALPGTERDGHDYVQQAAQRGARYALVRQDFEGTAACTFVRVPDPLRALQEIAAAYRRRLSARVVAITGSYGKTVTKDLLASLLAHNRCCASRESFNSQVGVALSLLEIRSTDDIALIEVGISAPGEMDRLVTMVVPDAAILTSLDDAHLRTLGTRETLVQEKGKLLEAVAHNQWVLAPQNLWNLPQWLPSLAMHPRLPTVTSDPTRRFRFRIAFPSGERCTATLESGFPELSNVVTQAVRAAWLLDVSPMTIQKTLDGYRPEPMRTEVWTSSRGVTFINDCYGADPLSVDRALKMLPPEGDPIFMMNGAIPPPILKRLAKRGPVLHVGTTTGPNITAFESRRAAVRHLRTEQRQGRIVLIKGEKRQPLEALQNDLADGLGHTRLAVHMDAIRHNLTMITQRYNASVLPMIKANGYGTGAIPLARLFEHCDIPLLGVAHIPEAVQLRLAGIQIGLFVFAIGLHEVPQAVEWGLEVGVDDLATIHALNQEAALRARKVRVHLHINTGMTRFGCRPEEVSTLELAIDKSSNLELQGVFSHLGCADDPKKDRLTLKQLHAFSAACDTLKKQPLLRHIANSAGTLRFGLAGCNTVRLGLALLGLAGDPQLRPALNLTSRLAAIHTCKRGDWVSYGATYKIKKNGIRIGVIPMGYFDGLRRSFSPGGHVLIHGKSAPIVGDICMDYAMVDLAKVPDAKVGDSVLIFGQDDAGATHPVRTFASQGDLSPYELITGLGPRIQRLYIYDGEARDLL